MDQRLTGKRVVSSYKQIAETRLIDIIIETKEDYISLVSEFMEYCKMKQLDSTGDRNISAWIRECRDNKSIEESYNKMSLRLKPKYYIYFSKENHSLYQGIGFPMVSDSNEIIIYKSNPYTVDLV